MASKEKLRQLIAESVKNVLSDIFEETDKQRASRVLKALGGTLVNADKINHEELGAKLGISAIAVRRAIRDIREEQGMAEIRNKIKENFFVWNPSSKEEKTAFFEEVAEQVTSLIKDFFSSNEIIGNLFGPVKNVQINKVIHQDKFNLEFIIKFTSKQNPKINFSLIHMGTTTPSYMIFIETKSNNTKSNSLTWESESFDIIDTNVSKHIEPVLNNFLKYVLSTKEITQNLTKILGYIAKTISNKKLLHSNQGVDSNITLPNPIFRIENSRVGNFAKNLIVLFGQNNSNMVQFLIEYKETNSQFELDVILGPFKVYVLGTGFYKDIIDAINYIIPKMFTNNEPNIHFLETYKQQD